jgi:WD40 repeat protein
MPLSTGKARGTVRAVALDSQVVAAASTDPVVRLWLSRDAKRAAGAMTSSDESSGSETMSPVPSDGDDITTSAGSTTSVVVDNNQRCQQWQHRAAPPPPRQPLFDLSTPPDVNLVGHTGPVASLCLTDTTLFTGSWDYTVRLWSRSSEGSGGGIWGCAGVLTYDDWVGPLAARGRSLLVAAGQMVHVHDMETGALTRKFQDLVRQWPWCHVATFYNVMN